MKYTDYVLRSKHDHEKFIHVRIDGQSFAGRIPAVLYLKSIGFNTKESIDYLESLPEGRMGIEI